MKKPRPCLIILFLTCGLFLSCGGGGGGGNDLPPGAFYETPSGLTLFVPDSVNSHGLFLRDRVVTDPEEIHQILCRWLDERIQQWIATHPDMDPAYLLSVADRHLFVTMDHWAFPCKSSNTGLCAGSYTEGVLKSAIYAKGSGTEPPSASYVPPHTIIFADDVARWAGNDIWRTGLWYWGEVPSGDIGFHSVLDEFDHAIGIDHP